MTVTRGMLGEPARRGGALAGLGLAGSLPCSPVSLGRGWVKERHADAMIRRRRFGLTAPPGPARAGLRAGAGIPLAGSLIPSGPGWFTPRVTCRAARGCAAGRGDDADRHDGRPDSSGG